MKRSKSTPSLRQQPPQDIESRASVALTVAWMLTCLCTCAALLMAAAIWLISRSLGAGGPQNPLAALAPVMQVVATLTGLACLLLTPLALRIRRTPPPRAITFAALFIGVTPLVTLICRALLSRQ